MRVVLDCNIIISAGLNAGVCREVIATVVRRHELVFSTDVLREYVLVAKREKFRDSHEQLGQLIQILMRNATLMFLDLAISGGATVLVTGNKRHFPETEYKGVRIVSPREFVDMQDK